MTQEKFEELKASLEILDNSDGNGPWTYNLLTLIHKNPKTDLTDLAELTGNSEDLKLHIEKLTDLGLAFANPPGYSLSSLGKQFLAKLQT